MLTWEYLEEEDPFLSELWTDAQIFHVPQTRQLKLPDRICKRPVVLS